MAVALEIKGSIKPVFGAVWFQATLETDRDERTALITSITIQRARFPEKNEQTVNKLKNLLEKELYQQWRKIVLEPCRHPALLSPILNRLLLLRFLKPD